MEKERRESVANRAYNANAIIFGEVKEGALEAYNFSSSASITTTHSKNKSDGKSVANNKTLMQSTFSIGTGTSKVTDGNNEEDNTDNKTRTSRGEGQES